MKKLHVIKKGALKFVVSPGYSHYLHTEKVGQYLKNAFKLC